MKTNNTTTQSTTIVSVDNYKLSLTSDAMRAIAQAKEVSGIILKMIDELNTLFIEFGQGNPREYTPQQCLETLSDLLLTKERIADIAAIDIRYNDLPVKTE